MLEDMGNSEKFWSIRKIKQFPIHWGWKTALNPGVSSEAD
jgi:hypothetical protein